MPLGPSLCGAYAEGVASCACAHKFCPPKPTLCGLFQRSKFDECREACCSSSDTLAATSVEDIPHNSPVYEKSCGPSCRAQGSRVRVRLRPKSNGSLRGPIRFIVDSGSAFHIANKGECSPELLARICNLDPALEMSTVNGHITVEDGLEIEVPALKQGIQFALLPNSPSIISLGRLCMLSGYSLHWPSSSPPYLIDPSGQRIDLVVEN